MYSIGFRGYFGSRFLATQRTPHVQYCYLRTLDPAREPCRPIFATPACCAPCDVLEPGSRGVHQDCSGPESEEKKRSKRPRLLAGLTNQATTFICWRCQQEPRFVCARLGLASLLVRSGRRASHRSLFPDPKHGYRHAQTSLSLNTDCPIPSSTWTLFRLRANLSFIYNWYFNHRLLKLPTTTYDTISPNTITHVHFSNALVIQNKGLQKNA